MADIEEGLRHVITTGLNVGEKADVLARRHGLSTRAVKEMGKARHRLREPKVMEGEGRIMHNSAVLERWDERPERKVDAQRRTASKKLTDELLKRYGLVPPSAPIIVPDAAPTRGSWRRKAKP